MRERQQQRRRQLMIVTMALCQLFAESLRDSIQCFAIDALTVK